MRGLILAVQFLTRLPTPQVAGFSLAELAGAARWFPLVGVLVGLCVVAGMALGSTIDPLLGALLGLIVWVWVTGALHLDGLADLADALGAAHRNRERLLAVLADPHLGVFGGVALVMQLLAKLVLLILIARDDSLWALLLIPAWARWGVLLWSRLPSLKPGLAQPFIWQPAPLAAWVNGAVLMALSLCLAPSLGLAPLGVLAWWFYLRKKLGGVTGDALGAGIEWLESGLLLLLVLLSNISPILQPAHI